MEKLIKIDPIRSRRLLFFMGQIAWRGRHILLTLLITIIGVGLLISLFDGKSLAPITWPAQIVTVFIGLNGLIFTGVIVAFTLKALELTFREDLKEMELRSRQNKDNFDPEP